VAFSVCIILVLFWWLRKKRESVGLWRLRGPIVNAKPKQQITLELAAPFLFLHFSKKIYRNIFFGFRFYISIPLPPGRGAAGTYM